MGNYIDLTGKKYERWSVLKRVVPKTTKEIMYLCKCDCGVIKEVLGASLRGGVSKSCGCHKIESSRSRATKHGMKGSRIYRIWKLMKQRCLDNKVKGYPDYGGRGITVCEKWMRFEGFYEDVILGYEDSLQLDRVDNDKGYYKENCRWTTPKENANNKRNNRLIEYNGVTDTLTNQCILHGISFHTAKARLKLGWSVEKTFTTPVRIQKIRGA